MVSMIQRLAAMAARGPAFSQLVASLERADRHRPNLLRVLIYHRVAEIDAQPHLGDRLISATPENFDLQMAYLAANYHVLSMPDVLRLHRERLPFPARAVSITFDDAYRDFDENAWPVLERYGLSATLFVPTAFPDRPERTFWWDRLHQAFYATDRQEGLNTPLGRFSLSTTERRFEACDRLVDYAKSLLHHAAMDLVDRICDALGKPEADNQVLGWKALRRLTRKGVTLGAHTRSHPLLNRLPLDEARAEAVASLRDLQREVGTVLPIFAYPAGGHDQGVVDALRHDGFELAFTTVPGMNDMRVVDPLQLRRIHVGKHTTLPILRARLASRLPI